MKVGFLIGRIIVGGYYLFGAGNLFLKHAAMADYAQFKGVPLPGPAVAAAGVLLLVGGLTILFGWQPRIGIAALALFFLGVTPLMHNFWAVAAAESAGQLVHFTKNLALLGSALMFLAIPEPWPLGLSRQKK
jgi:putative oxidoreductase